MSNIQEKIGEVQNKFNEFIKKWTTSYSHLIDSDENDGERFRRYLEDSFEAVARQAVEEERKRILELIEKHDAYWKDVQCIHVTPKNYLVSLIQKDN